MPRQDQDPRERFNAKWELDLEMGCWLWTAATENGYGRFHFEGAMRWAHRIAWVLFVGLIPEELELDHLCRVRHCVNPEHLEPVTHRENVLRGDGGPAVNAKKTYCPQGHPLEGENLVARSLRRGKRECRTCWNEQQKAYYQRRKAA